VATAAPISAAFLPTAPPVRRAVSFAATALALRVDRISELKY
jgi:hypothetical protein